MCKKDKWIRCEDGSYLQIRRIHRLSVQENVVDGIAAVKAHISGMQHPYTIANYENTQCAQNALMLLIDRLEGCA